MASFLNLVVFLSNAEVHKAGQWHRALCTWHGYKFLNLFLRFYFLDGCILPVTSAIRFFFFLIESNHTLFVFLTSIEIESQLFQLLWSSLRFWKVTVGQLRKVREVLSPYKACLNPKDIVLSFSCVCDADIMTSTVCSKEDKEGRGIPKAKVGFPYDLSVFWIYEHIIITRDFFTQLGILLGKAADMEQSTIENERTIENESSDDTKASS